jgi:hypothetical protein
VGALFIGDGLLGRLAAKVISTAAHLKVAPTNAEQNLW